MDYPVGWSIPLSQVSQVSKMATHKYASYQEEHNTRNNYIIEGVKERKLASHEVSAVTRQL